jgi:hypothetical protein
MSEKCHIDIRSFGFLQTSFGRNKFDLSWFRLLNFEDAQMKHISIALAAALVSSTFAFADTPITPAEAEKIKAALEAFGCTGGKMEKETEGSGYFEVDDAKCRDGQYDIKLDKDFKIISMTRD